MHVAFLNYLRLATMTVSNEEKANFFKTYILIGVIDFLR